MLRKSVSFEAEADSTSLQDKQQRGGGGGGGGEARTADGDFSVQAYRYAQASVSPRGQGPSVAVHPGVSAGDVLAGGPSVQPGRYGPLPEGCAKVHPAWRRPAEPRVCLTAPHEQLPPHGRQPAAQLPRPRPLPLRQRDLSGRLSRAGDEQQIQRPQRFVAASAEQPQQPQQEQPEREPAAHGAGGAGAGGAGAVAGGEVDVRPGGRGDEGAAGAGGGEAAEESAPPEAKCRAPRRHQQRLPAPLREICGSFRSNGHSVC
mmetsp:Transcript_2832/g.5189  ORF Transcript_2832/g.5189 Transcript_2832/m.5189 type:complete len:260 (+) Transcript_2832:585-1364(+)